MANFNVYKSHNRAFSQVLSNVSNVRFLKIQVKVTEYNIRRDAILWRTLTSIQVIDRILRRLSLF